VGGAALPSGLPPAISGLGRLPAIELDDASWDRDVARLVGALRPRALANPPPAAASPRTAVRNSALGAPGGIRGWFGRRGAGQLPGGVGGVLGGTRNSDIQKSAPTKSAPRFRLRIPPIFRRAGEKAAAEASIGGAAALEAEASAATADRPPEPVLLGVSAPRHVGPGKSFTARFVAYIQALEQAVRQRLDDLSGGEAETALGIAPDSNPRWRIGTPVTVEVSGPQLSARPARRSFEWNGEQNMLNFLVSVAPEEPHGPTQICFEVFIEGMSISFISMDLKIGAVPAGAVEPAKAVVRPPSTAFACYASQDADQVSLCLSALAHWDPGLDVFIDCLDLTPNADWKRQLEAVIPQKDVFLLFWSTHAARSEWVEWEWQTARAKKGIKAIHPFPLEDPAISPPPDDLRHLHFRDRYMMARQGLIRISERKAALGDTKTPDGGA